MAYEIPKLADYSSGVLDSAFAELFNLLDSDGQGAQLNSGTLQEVRERWLGRKSGVITQVSEEWLKPAPKEQKRDVGRRLNELKKKVDEIIEAASATHS